MSFKGTDACLEKIGDDEPIFVLRAQDALAGEAVRGWARDLCGMLHGVGQHHPRACPEPKVREAVETAMAMDRWPNRKIPD